MSRLEPVPIATQAGTQVDLRDVTVLSEDDFRNEVTMAGRLGGGSFGVVNACTYQGRRAAVKLLFQPSDASVPCQDGEGSRRLAGWQAAASALQEEARLQAQFDGEHMVRVYAVCYAPPALIMEMCSHGSLRDRLNEAQHYQQPLNNQKRRVLQQLMQWHMRLEFLLQAAAALALVHDAEVLHNDLRAENLLLHHDGHRWQLKLADFGLACKVGGDVTAKEKRTNPLWLAPELLRVPSAPLTKASDVYALAAVMWEVMTGLVPHATADVRDLNLLACQVQFRPRKLEYPAPEKQLLCLQTWTAAPDELKPVFDDCCAHEQSGRPTAHKAQERLKQLLKRQRQRQRQQDSQVQDVQLDRDQRPTPSLQQQNQQHQQDCHQPQQQQQW